MSEAIKERGQTPIGSEEDGYILLFSNADIRRLQDKLGKDFVHQAHSHMIQEWDWPFMDAVAAAGIKKDGKAVEGMSFNHELFENAPIAQTAIILLDALFVSCYGRTFTEHVMMVAEQVEQAAQEGEPVPRLTPTSTLSQSFGEGVSEPESTPKNTGGSARAKSASSRLKRKRSGSGKRGSPPS